MEKLIAKLFTTLFFSVPANLNCSLCSTDPYEAAVSSCRLLFYRYWDVPCPWCHPRQRALDGQQQRDIQQR